MIQYLLLNTLIGILATGIMSSFLWFIGRYDFIKTDMIRTIGYLYSRNEETAFTPGIIIHFLSGILFSLIYVALFQVFPVGESSTIIYLVLGPAVGFVHGVVVGLLLVIIVAEHHPLEKYKKVGFGVAVFYFLAHIIYGFSVAFFYKLLLI